MIAVLLAPPLTETALGKAPEMLIVGVGLPVAVTVKLNDWLAGMVSFDGLERGAQRRRSGRCRVVTLEMVERRSGSRGGRTGDGRERGNGNARDQHDRNENEAPTRSPDSTKYFPTPPEPNGRLWRLGDRFVPA